MNEPSDASYARAAIAEPTAPDDAQVPATPKDSCSVEWLDQLAVGTLPDHIDVSNVSHIGKKLLLVINRGASALIADMTATVSCNHASADAMVRARRQALTTGTPCGWWSPPEPSSEC